MCCIVPGNYVLHDPLGNYVLHHPWESMCCTSPGTECVASFGPCERKSLCFACTFSRAWEVYAIGVSVSDAMHAHSVELGKSMPLGFLCVKLCVPIHAVLSWPL